MTFEDAKQLLANQTDNDAAMREWRKALSLGQAHPHGPGPGRMSVGEALATFGLRQRTAAAEGREIVGIDSVLDRLLRRERGEDVLLFHFDTEDRFYTVFMHEDGPEVIGCISGKRNAPDA